jgi:hypothetical protein
MLPAVVSCLRRAGRSSFSDCLHDLAHDSSTRAVRSRPSSPRAHIVLLLVVMAQVVDNDLHGPHGEGTALLQKATKRRTPLPKQQVAAIMFSQVRFLVFTTMCVCELIHVDCTSSWNLSVRPAYCRSSTRCALVQLAHSYLSNRLIPQMVAEFDVVGGDKAKVGYYVGIMVRTFRSKCEVLRLSVPHRSPHSSRRKLSPSSTGRASRIASGASRSSSWASLE